MTVTKYTEDHEYIRVEGDVGVVGISDYAQGQLGDVVFVELPDPGAEYAQGDEAAVVESVKAASEVYAPVGGEVTEANDALAESPGLVNSDPTGEGWFFKLRIADPKDLDQLMSAEDYKDYVKDLD